MSQINNIALIFLLVELIFLYFLYKNGNAKYSDYVTPLKKEQFKMKDFLPIGMMLLELLKYKYGTSFDRKLRKGIAELYDSDYTEYYLRVYWAIGAVYLILGITVATLLNMATNGDVVVTVAGIGMGALLVYINFNDLLNKIKMKHLKISIDLPDLTNKIVILSGAGLTIRAAIIKISNEMSSNSPLYVELSKAVIMMENGATNEAALDHLNIKCNMPEMRRFVSVILQNMQRGGTDVLKILQEIGKEQWDNRKAAAKSVAEEAGTKMLFPMMVMLLAVILLTIAPAVMGMKL